MQAYIWFIDFLASQIRRININNPNDQFVSSFLVEGILNPDVIFSRVERELHTLLPLIEKINTIIIFLG